MPKIFSTIILALALFTATFAVNLQTPLYGVYTAESDMGATAVTIAFAAYVVGLMPTLLLLGGLSDRIGRRLPITISLLLVTIATLLLVLIPNWESLFIARLLLGIGTGLVTTAGTAYMIEIMGSDNARRATLIVTSSTSLGFGGGALATSLSLGIQGPTLIPISFIVLFVMAPILALIGLKMPRVDVPKHVSLIKLPVFPTKTWVFGIAMALAWSTTGMIIAIVPLELKIQNFDGWTGLVIFLAIFIGFLCQPIARRMTNPKALALGLLLTPIGFLVLLTGFWTQSIILILVGTSITSAASYGFTYLSALFEFSSRDPNNRARATAGLFIYAYIGFSLPVIASGALADMFGLLPAMAIFSVIQIAITLITIWFWKKHSAF
ncbi:MFS transporter [Xenorhabdus bovienii]|uniref:Membrane protein, major facilitator transporter family n=1 Tax=Xenorhabdus bovienii str. oregonense TaxID=1398202 RepID=A0A077NX95_XENBV|nr:MFS transporter [Xenorhabdus bovienii]MDE9541120.1 MFS transporter [Xenorhabdus bovienii]CDH06772.1 Membrane protein, major facilitator transporter family [Xenorhabdus bovienii str. oregonense]